MRCKGRCARCVVVEVITVKRSAKRSEQGLLYVQLKLNEEGAFLGKVQGVLSTHYHFLLLNNDSLVAIFSSVGGWIRNVGVIPEILWKCHCFGTCNSMMSTALKAKALVLSG